MPTERLYAKPGHLIRRCQQIAVALFIDEASASGFDVTPVQYAALIAILESPGVEATTLAAMIAYDRSTLGDVVERLVSKGLVDRTADPKDRRVKHLSVTRAGTRLAAQIEPAVVRAQARILAPLTPADRKRFLALLAQLVDINNVHSRAPLRAVGA